MRPQLHGYSWRNLLQVPQNPHELHQPLALLASPELLSTPLSSLSTFHNLEPGRNLSRVLQNLQKSAGSKEPVSNLF